MVGAKRRLDAVLQRQSRARAVGAGASQPDADRLAVDGHQPGPGATLMALADDERRWTRWRIIDWKNAELLLCEFHSTNAGLGGQVHNAYLQFGLADDPEGCTLEVEIGAEGTGLVGDFLVGTSLGISARRMLPRLVDAFSEHVIERVNSQP